MTDMPPRRSLGLARSRWIPHFVIFLAVGAVYASGLLDFLEFKLDEARFQLQERTPSETLVIVEIDGESLHELSVWPWPRRYHAKAIERLFEAGARRVAFDVDFSSRSVTEEDQALERALAAHGESVILPAFMQSLASLGAQGDDLLTTPLPIFAQHTSLASANVMAESDGRVRRVLPNLPWGEVALPSLFAALAGSSAEAPASFYIDFSIRSTEIPRISFADVVAGRFAADLVVGKDVLIGATAIELGDQIPVPVVGVLPGVVVQALAYESMIGDRALQRFARGPVLLAGLLIAILLGPLFLRWSWCRGLAVTGALVVAMPLFAAALQAAWPVILDITPWLFIVGLSYAYALITRLKQQDLRLVAQSLAIRRRDAFMRQVVEHSFEGIITFDEAGVVRSFDQAAERIFGYRQDAVVGRDVRTLLHDTVPEDAWKDAADISELRGGPFEFVAKREDGDCHPVQIAISEMVQNDERLCVALVRDMSQQRRAEAEAKEAQILLREAIDRINEGFALYDEQDQLVLCNRKFRELLFDAREPAPLGSLFEDIIRRLAEHGRVPLAAEQAEEWFSDRLARHRSPDGPYEEQFDDGTCVLISERATHNGGRVAILTDVTELKEKQLDLRRAVERAETASRSKTEFLANMSHELRTPLNAIIGFSEIMTKEALGPVGTPRYREYAKDINSSGTHLLGLINDVLDVSKIEAGKYKLSEETVEIGDIVESSRRLVSARAEQAGHELIVDLPESLPLLLADPRTLKQVLLNLLSNAVKFTPDGGRISLRAHVLDDGSMEVQVTDTGIGIAANDLPHAMALFGQVDSKLARKYEGTGLGLPLSRNLMQLHGGTLQVGSEVGEGTTVALRFPARRVLSETPLAEPELLKVAAR
jgi:PAS domain S-box-containing protein